MEECFAYSKDECFALMKKQCRNCSFYKKKSKAKKEYIATRELAQKNNIDEKIDTYFMSL